MKKHGGISEAQAANLVEHALAQQADPDSFLQTPHADQILAAFFCFSIVSLESTPGLRRVLTNIPFQDRDQFFCWRWHSHPFCSLDMQARVNAANLALSAMLSAELVEKILSIATAENEVELL